MQKIFFLLVFAAPLLSDNYSFSFPQEYPIRKPRDFSLYADALALQAKEGGLDFAIEDANGAAFGIANGRVQGFSSNKSDYEFNPGLRVGMGLLFGDDRWNFDMVWTFLKITNSKHLDVSGSEVLIPLWLIPEANSTNQSLHAVWNTNFNLLDFRMGKAFHISRFLVANPHFGGRIAFIDQHFSVHHGGFYGARQGAVSHNDNDFAGLGIRGGIDTQWRVAHDFALFGNVAGSILWGHFLMTQDLAQGVTQGYNLFQDLNQNIPNIEMILGMSWTHSFNKDQFRLNARLAYEFHEWWDMNHLRHIWSSSHGVPNAVSSRGNFTLNGISLRFQVDL